MRPHDIGRRNVDGAGVAEHELQLVNFAAQNGV